MTDSAIKGFQSLADKSSKAPQAKVRFLQFPAASPPPPRPGKPQFYPYIQQEETQPHQQKPIGNIIRRRPAAHLSRAAVTAFNAKPPTILLAHLLGLDLKVDQNVDQPVGSLLVPVAS